MFCSDVTQILVDVAFHFGASMRAASSSKYDPSSTATYLEAELRVSALRECFTVSCDFNGDRSSQTQYELS